MRLPSVLLPLLPALVAGEEGATATRFDAPPPYGSVQIRDVQTSGSGCPPGSVSIQISADQTTVTIGMTKMGAYFGPDYQSSDNLRNCALHIDLNYPGGYQFSIMNAVYNGYARLDPGVVGRLTASYFFSQSPSRIKYSRTDIEGEVYELGAPFQKSDTANDKTMVLSPCGNNGILNVNDILSIASRDRSQTGELNVFDATVSFTQQVYIQWSRCGSEDSDGSRSAASVTPASSSTSSGSRPRQSSTSGQSSTSRQGSSGSQDSSSRQGSRNNAASNEERSRRLYTATT